MRDGARYRRGHWLASRRIAMTLHYAGQRSSASASTASATVTCEHLQEGVFQCWSHQRCRPASGEQPAAERHNTLAPMAAPKA